MSSAVNAECKLYESGGGAYWTGLVMAVGGSSAKTITINTDNGVPQINFDDILYAVVWLYGDRK